MLMLVCFIYYVVPYQESTTLQLCRTAAAVGNTIYVRSHMTQTADTMRRAQRYNPAVQQQRYRQHHYVRVACPRYAAASYLCRSLSSCITLPYHTFLLCCRSGCACPSMREHRNLCSSIDLDTNPSLHIYVHTGSFLRSFFPIFLAKIADDRQRTTCREQNATGRGPCARAVSPLYGGELLCRSLSRIVLLLPRSQQVLFT